MPACSSHDTHMKPSDGCHSYVPSAAVWQWLMAAWTGPGHRHTHTHTSLMSFVKAQQVTKLSLCVTTYSKEDYPQTGNNVLTDGNLPSSYNTHTHKFVLLMAPNGRDIIIVTVLMALIIAMPTHKPQGIKRNKHAVFFLKEIS